MLLLVTFAAAATGALREVAIGIGASGESVLQGGLVDTYPTLATNLSAEITMSAALRAPVELTFQLGYHRADGTLQDGSGSWIWYLPVAGLVSGRLDMGRIAVLAGLGPSLVAWQEKGSPEAVADRLDWGARWGLATELSVRWHSDLVRAPIYEETRTTLGLDIYASVGARISDVADAAATSGCSDEPCGFDWSAARLGVGVLARF